MVTLAGTSQAANGVIDMSWNVCAPVVQDITTTTPGQYSLYLSVLGIDQAHQAYEVTYIYSNSSSTVPDAWRFDPAGCQGSSFVTIDHLAPAAVSKVCPTFQGALQSVQVKDVAFVPPSDSRYLQTNMRVSLFNAYPAGIPTTNPATRYFLGRTLFDHTFSVVGPTDPGNTCGGFEQSICFKLIRGNYLDLAGTEIPFDRNVAVGAPLFVTFNGPAGCAGVPAQAKTWGQIKNQYRN
jgi:hypothetical protein